MGLGANQPRGGFKMIEILLGLAAGVSTGLGGLFALRSRDNLHLILGFSAGAVIGVAFFDLLPEALNMAEKDYHHMVVTSAVACGFLAFMLLNRIVAAQMRKAEGSPRHLEALGLSLHSVLDGFGMGLAFEVSPSLGFVVAAAVLAHDFSDGINIVSLVVKGQGDDQTPALRWLWVNSISPIAGVLLAKLFVVPATTLGLLLAVFSGFFIYIGASELIPESQHKHPLFSTSVFTVLGAAVIFIAIQFAHF